MSFILLALISAESEEDGFVSRMHFIFGDEYHLKNKNVLFS